VRTKSYRRLEVDPARASNPPLTSFNAASCFPHTQARAKKAGPINAKRGRKKKRAADVALSYTYLAWMTHEEFLSLRDYKGLQEGGQDPFAKALHLQLSQVSQLPWLAASSLGSEESVRPWASQYWGRRGPSLWASALSAVNQSARGSLPKNRWPHCESQGRARRYIPYNRSERLLPRFPERGARSAAKFWLNRARSSIARILASLRISSFVVVRLGSVRFGLVWFGLVSFGPIVWARVSLSSDSVRRAVGRRRQPPRRVSRNASRL
jgi:hypothetical protein